MIHDSFYSQIELGSIRTDIPLRCDLYIKEKDRYVLFRSSTLRISEEDLERLRQRGVTELWIRVSHDQLSRRQMAAVLALPDDQFPSATKASLVHTSVTATAQRLYSQHVTQSAICDTRELLSTTLSYLTSSESGFPALLAALSQDYSLHHHTVNVTVYALGLGKFIGIKDVQDLENLGIGAFLHDIGKSRLPEEILGKTGPFSPEEWSEICSHPISGQDLLKSITGLPVEALRIVTQHHERLDGSGYPSAIGAEDLGLFPRLVGLVDAYDDLTLERPFRAKLTPYRALLTLREDVGTKLDSYLFVSFVRLLGGYSLNQGPLGGCQSSRR